MRLRVEFDAAPLAPLPPVERLLAGAAEVDITPPPGLPKAGYSRNARDGTGFRTRLRARVVHLRCGTSSLAIVAGDLLAGSAVLQHGVANAVAATTDVPLHGLLIGATHTHGAPGQFHGTGFYNRYASNRPGFDPDWSAFLVERIAAAVGSAVRSRRPAVLGWGRATVPGFTRNRSLPAYRRNPGHEGALASEAVNPWLDLLRVDGIDGEPLATLAVFSVHGTAVPMTTGPYNADLWSYLCTHLGDRIAGAGGRRPVVGALQGTHGDVTPALQAPAGHAEAARIGRGIAKAAAEVHASLAPSLTATPDLGTALRVVDLAGLGRPAVGAALVAGARENLTPVVSALPIFRAGHGKRWSRGPHGAKWVLGSRPLQALMLPLDGFPAVWPVQLLRIGPVLLAGTPMELTTHSGRRMAEAVSRALSDPPVPDPPVPDPPVPDPPRVVVTSVANEYAGYCTTPPEYGAQFYEGGHTLYGPATLEFLAASAQALAAELAGAPDAAVQDAPSRRTVELAVHRFMPRRAGAGGLVRSAGPPYVHSIGDVEWCWAGAAQGAVRWHEPMVLVEAQDRVRGGGGWRPLAQPGGRVLDDGHGDLSVTLRRDRVLGDLLVVRWHATEVASVPTEALPGAAGAPRYRFRLLLAAGAGPAGLASPSF